MRYIIAGLLLIGSIAAEPKYVINSKRLSTREIAISCNNGGDPAGQKIGDTLIISCGK